MAKVNVRKAVVSAVAATLIATAAQADTDATANIAVDGTGQFLVAPGFWAEGNFETKIKLVNTDVDSAIIMRAVIRDKYCSEEVDFNIYLTPGDVWTGVLREVDGKTHIVATDDSMDPPVYTVMSDDGYALNNANNNAHFKSGYIEFYPVLEVDMNDDQAVDSNYGSAIAKSQMATLEDYAIALGSVTYGATTVTGTSTVFDTHVINRVNDESVHGSVTFVNTSSDYESASTIPMMHFEDVQDGTIATISQAAIEAKNDTTPGNYINAASVYTLLQATSVAIPFDNSGENSTQVMTFWYDYYGQTNNEATGDHSCSATQARSFSADIRDTDETLFTVTSQNISPQSPDVLQFKYEVSEKSIAEIRDQSSYTNGWVNIISFLNTTATNQIASGLNQPAVIPSMLKAEELTSGHWTSNWNYNPRILTNN